MLSRKRDGQHDSAATHNTDVKPDSGCLALGDRYRVQTHSLGQTGLNILIMVQKIDTHTVNNQQSSHTFALALESQLVAVLTHDSVDSGDNGD